MTPTVALLALAAPCVQVTTDPARTDVPDDRQTAVGLHDFGHSMTDQPKLRQPRSA